MVYNLTQNVWWEQTIEHHINTLKMLHTKVTENLTDHFEIVLASFVDACTNHIFK